MNECECLYAEALNELEMLEDLTKEYPLAVAEIFPSKLFLERTFFRRTSTCFDV